jgi:L-rhamnose-H+ transport protein
MTASFASSFALVCLGGVLTGIFAAPMKYLLRWRWENIWLVYAFCAQVAIPTLVIAAVVPGLAGVYASVPTSSLLLILLCGYLWGVGSVTFGIGVDRLGMGLGFSLIIGISTLLGTLLPFFMAGELQLRVAVFGSGFTLLLGGVALAGVAGVRRERDQAGTGSRVLPYASGLVICTISGILSSLFNIGMVVARPVQERAAAGGAPAWAAGDAAWPLFLFGGFLANATWCGYLLKKNGTAALYRAGGWREWAGSVAMGAAWIGGVLAYGAGAWSMGALGPVLGFPVFTSLMVLCAYAAGRVAGEWRGVLPGTQRWMNAAIALSVLSLFLLGYSK